MRLTKQEILDKIKGQLIVSCQALPSEPLYVEEKSIMYLMARAAKQAGSPLHPVPAASATCLRSRKKPDFRSSESSKSITTAMTLHYSHHERGGRGSMQQTQISSLWTVPCAKRRRKHDQRIYRIDQKKISGRHPHGRYFHLRGGRQRLEMRRRLCGNHAERLYGLLPQGGQIGHGTGKTPLRNPGYPGHCRGQGALSRPGG